MHEQFDVLLSEHNVTRAAARLNLSQSSVSVHLAKLREVLSDPLPLAGPRGMRPTARAEALREALEALERGELDIAFHTREDAPVGMRRRVLFAGRYVLVGRADHPRLKRRPTLAQFCKLEHVIVSPDGGGFVGVTDATLAQAGLTRKVVLSVPHFLFMMSVLENTDLVAMVPARLVRHTGAQRTVAPPVAVPGYDMAMLWHERSHRDPAHQWLRETLAASA